MHLHSKKNFYCQRGTISVHIHFVLLLSAFLSQALIKSFKELWHSVLPRLKQSRNLAFNNLHFQASSLPRCATLPAILHSKKKGERE